MQGFIFNDFKNIVLNLTFYESQKVHLFNSEGLHKGVEPGSDIWNNCMKEITGSNTLTEEQAKAFTRDMGEEQIKAKIMESILTLDYPPIEPRVKDMTIEVLFYGAPIATYQNGEVVLKR